jgi:Coenzyme PQQ synthesis protein D (PqqD)
MELQDAQRIVARQDVLSRALDGEMVLLDLGGGRYYGLNEVGSEAWQLISDGVTIGELTRHLLTQFDVEEARLRDDLGALVAELVSRSLVDVSD